ncbi:MAG: FtsH protease activity modulator HflK [Candidatus Dadabacteria bacterium]|nr:MAG: FtsH protease activity modulator HflK [Candidatus Dadabacteria bacterium]
MNWNGQAQGDPPGPNIDEFIQNLLNNPRQLVTVIVVIILIAAGLTSVYQVEPYEEAVVTRFGRYTRTEPPGLHFKLPFTIEQAIKVPTTRIQSEEFGVNDEESLMLTGDLNVADVQWVVQYRISDPYKYLFKVRDPRKNVRDISQAVMRRVVGDRTVDDVLTTGQEELSYEAKKLTQQILDQYEMGVEISEVALQPIRPPEKVRPSFNEVNEAKQEQRKIINEAERYANKVLPEAKGRAKEQISRAEGYAIALINKARGDADKFKSVLKEYKKAPEVTRTRLYLELVEELAARVAGLTVIDPAVKGVLPLFSAPDARAGLANAGTDSSKGKR